MLLYRMWIPFLMLIQLKHCVTKSAIWQVKKYHEKHETDVSIRIITDHIRSATFMISDGIMPSNEGRGYVLRRLISRAARHGRLLGIEGSFPCRTCSKLLLMSSKDGYPELEEKKDFIFKVLHKKRISLIRQLIRDLLFLQIWKKR